MTDTDDDTETVYDLKELDRQATLGNKAYGELHKHAGDDWQRWEATIIGLAALRDMTFAKIGHRNMRSQDYRDGISALMMRPKFAQYGLMRRQERSACYKLMDRIHEVSAWYAALPSADKMAWKHPETLVKHVPQQFLAMDLRDNQLRKSKKQAGKKKRASSAEEERLRQILLTLIREFVMPSNPQRAGELLKMIYPEGDPDDDLGDLGVEEG